MEYKIVFCDVDGTLVTSKKEVLPGTVAAVKRLEEKGIPFVIISGRFPPGIYSVQEEYGISGPIISYSGGLIRDKDRNTLYSTGFSTQTAASVIDFIESSKLDCAWNVFYGDSWIVKDRTHPRVRYEEDFVHALASVGDVSSIPADTTVGKVLLMADPDVIDRAQELLQSAFPELTIVKSASDYLEVMKGGISKGKALKKMCGFLDIPVCASIAFGDNYNDEDMLMTAGMPFLMGNAPGPLKQRIPNITRSNDDDGISHALHELGVI